MKRLLLLWIFSGSLDCFCQDVVHPLYMLPNDKPDTIPSRLLISAKPPAFGHSIDGYCIYSDRGVCTGEHLVRRKIHRKWVYIPVEERNYDVWRCKRRAMK